jgi:hypothetical protein
MGMIKLVAGLGVAMGCVLTTVCVIFGWLPPFAYECIVLVLGLTGGIWLMGEEFMIGRITSVFMKAKLTGKSVIAVVTASKGLDLLVGDEQEGMSETKKGYFIVNTGSVYMWPNNIRGMMAFYKYGYGLTPKFIKSCSILKKNDVNDIEEATMLYREAQKNKKEVILNMNEELGETNA